MLIVIVRVSLAIFALLAVIAMMAAAAAASAVALIFTFWLAFTLIAAVVMVR